MAQAQLESEVEFFRGYKYVLSNFFRFDLTFEGQKYHSVEQAYQVKKATIYGDEDAKRRILFTMNAHRAWLIGKDIKVDDKWSEKRVEVMRELLKAKLEQCPTYYRKLLSCKGLIVEAVPNQTFWSAGLEKEELVKLPRDQWPGENMLGKLHMELRDQIRKRKTEPRQSEQRRKKQQNLRRCLTRLWGPVTCSRPSRLHRSKSRSKDHRALRQWLQTQQIISTCLNRSRQLQTTRLTMISGRKYHLKKMQQLRSSSTQSLQTLTTIWSIIVSTYSFLVISR